MTDVLRLRYMPLSRLKKWSRNPKLHDLQSIVESIREHGFRDALIYDATLKSIIAGNGRVEALEWMRVHKEKPPRGIQRRDDEWFVPVQLGVDAKTVRQAESFGIDHNSLVLLGGDFTDWDIERLYDASYRDLIIDLKIETPVISVSDEELDRMVGECASNKQTKDDDDAIVCPRCAFRFLI